MNSLNSIYELAGNVTYTSLDEEQAVLLHLSSRRYYSVNETGKLILDRIQEGASSEEMAESLAARYDVSMEEALSHVGRLLDELREEELIEKRGSSAES